MQKGQLKKLKPKHKEVLDAYFDSPNVSKTSLSKQFGMARISVIRLFDSPVARAYLSRKETEIEKAALIAKKKAYKLAPEAVDNLADDIRMDPRSTGDRKVRQAASVKILDMIYDGIESQNMLNTGPTFNTQINIEGKSPREIRDMLFGMLEGPANVQQE